MKKTITLLLGIFCISLCSYAEVFMHTNEKGHITYSDTPKEGSEKLDLPSLQTIPSHTQPLPILSEQPVTEATTETIRKPYTTFEITSPKNQETFHNQPTIPVIFKVIPELHPGDTIQLFIDGKPIGNAKASTHLELPRIDRGTHSLSAKIIDEKNNVIKETRVLTIYVHYAHLGT